MSIYITEIEMVELVVCVPLSFYWRLLLKTQDISVGGSGPYL